MFIKSLNISNLGYIQSLEIQFSNNKVNILQGRNGCGKTTILATLYSILQDKEILQYKSEGSKTQILTEIFEDNCKVKVKKSYVDGRPQLLIDSFDEMKKLLSIRRDRLYLFSGEFIGNKYKLDSDQINNAGKLLNKLEIVDEYAALISAEDNKSYNFMSGGMQAYYWILNLLYHVPQNSVVMIDELFAKLDLHTSENILNIMDQIENVQFILTASLMMDVKRDYNKIVLESKYVHSYRNSVPDFSYRRVFSNSLKVLSALVNDEKRNSNDRHIIKYELGKEIVEVENRSVEFKEIKGNNPCNSIIDNAEIYINSYLNSRVSGVGIIKWGISDEGIIKGVRLSKKDRDTIDKMISEKVGQMKPYVSTEGIHISFEEIISEGKIMNELFIVEISVESVDSDVLFSTSKSEIYIKTDGGKRKLNPFEIQQELRLRLKL